MHYAAPMTKQLNIRALRKRLGYTRKELAKAVGVKAETTIWRWESGTKQPRGSAEVLLRQLDERSRQTSPVPA